MVTLKNDDKTKYWEQFEEIYAYIYTFKGVVGDPFSFSFGSRDQQRFGLLREE